MLNIRELSYSEMQLHIIIYSKLGSVYFVHTVDEWSGNTSLPILKIVRNCSTLKKLIHKAQYRKSTVRSLKSDSLKTLCVAAHKENSVVIIMFLLRIFRINYKMLMATKYRLTNFTHAIIVYFMIRFKIKFRINVWDSCWD